MKIALAVGLNIGILLLLVRWVLQQRRESPLGRWLLPLLALKVLAAAAAAYLLTADAFFVHYWAHALSYQYWDRPLDWLRMLPTDEYHYKRGNLVFHGFSNAFFVIKLMSVVRLASNGSVFLESLYPSLFSFVGAWQLVRSLARVFPAAPAAAPLVGWLIWPTVVFWTAGLTKESLLVGSGAWLLALVLPWLYGGEKPRPATVLGALLLGILHFKVRFFFALPLFAVLTALAVIRLLQHLGAARRRSVQVVVLAGVLVGGAWMAGQLSPVFSFNKFSSQLLQIYGDIQANSINRPHIEYDHLAPTPESVVANTPKAIVSTLVRPWLWESRRPLYLLVSVENTLLLVILTVAVVALGRGKGGQLPFALVLALVVYCLSLAALMGLSTPNLGTLNRYRSALLPVLLLLALQNDYAARWLRRLEG